MSEERLQEIKDSINFQYELIVSKGIDRSALLFTDEEQELLEEVERLNKENEHLRTALNTKENIIKEVREYMNKHEIEEVYLDCKLYETQAYKDILEILGRAEEE